MALSVATNVGALSAATAASSVNRSMETSMARCSTGLRINLQLMTLQACQSPHALNLRPAALTAYKNAADAQSLVDTADSASIEIGNLFSACGTGGSRCHDTNSSADRTNIKAEIDELINEMNAITEDTNGLKTR